MPSFKTKNGFVIETFPPPPAGFDVAAASDGERSAHGFAAFSKDPALRARLKRQLQGFQFVVPQFEPREIKPKKTLALDRKDVRHPPHTTPNWAGAMVLGAPGEPICAVEGSWTVPATALPPGAPGGQIYAASPWVGIDGDAGSRDVLQAGCDAEINTGGGTRFRLWYEWYPGDSQYITNVPIGPGDVLGVTLRLMPGSNTAATVLITKPALRLALTYAVQAAPGFGLVGNCAEWIVESNEQLGALANFGIVNFTGCQAANMSGMTVGAGGGIPVLMVDAYNRVVSAGQVAGPDAVRVSYVAV